MTFCFTWHHYQNDETNHSLEFWASWNCKFLFSSARRFCGAPTLTLLTSEARVDEIVVPAAKIVWIFNAWVFWIGNHLRQCPWWGWHLRSCLKVSFLLNKLVLVWHYSTMHSQHLPPQTTYTGPEMTPLRNIFFWSFLTKTKREEVLPSPVYGKIWPHSSSSVGYWCLHMEAAYPHINNIK